MRQPQDDSRLRYPEGTAGEPGGRPAAALVGGRIIPMSDEAAAGDATPVLADTRAPAAAMYCMPAAAQPAACLREEPDDIPSGGKEVPCPE